ncbi:MAG: hypothetical protein NTV23_10645 [Propionibacteriales bacterium]|nr:hypothetical protein [Propionibacteriales bacterium]
MDRDVLIDALLGVSALIHLAPVLGVLSVGHLEKLYGVEVGGPDLAVLLRHRAVLFGILGGLLVAGVLEHGVRDVAVVAVLVSDLAYAALCWVHRDHNGQLGRVLRADLVSIVVLVAAGVALLA